MGVELDRVTDEELAFHVHEAWRLIAPEKLHALVEEKAGIEREVRRVVKIKK